jgi:outer membrane biosynthesis protein TonB
MKIFPVILGLTLLFGVCSNTFGQKCKEGLPKGILAMSNNGKLKIIRKPEPQYTAEARSHQIQGTVMLRALFHSSGEVRNVCWVTKLPYGLTAKAIEAAYRITFEPVTKDDRPVSMRSLIEFNFNLY